MKLTTKSLLQLTVFGLVCAVPITFAVTSTLDSLDSSRNYDKALEICIESSLIADKLDKEDQAKYGYNNPLQSREQLAGKCKRGNMVAIINNNKELIADYTK
jgi:hypothetical protein